MSQTKKNLSQAQYKAVEIAQCFLSLDPERKFFTKKKGNFRLNTLLHISQMLYCAKTGKPLFKDPLIAYPPCWYKLSQKGQEKLSKIMSNKKVKDKKTTIYQLYQEEKIKLSAHEEKLFWELSKIRL